VREDMLTLIDGTKLDRDSVLGFISLFTVPDEPVPGTKLNRLWAAEALDPSLIPDARKAADVFAQACRQVETRKAGTNPAHRTEVKVDEVSNGPDQRVYQVTRMVTDQANQVIDHPKAMTLVLDKPTADGGAVAVDCINVIPRDPTTFGALKGLADSVLAYYDKNLTTVPGQKIRNAIRDYMKILGAENLRRKSGGVYFVPASGADTLESLERVLAKLYDGAADLHFIPQANTKAMQAMVAHHHTLNVVKECDEMIARITNRLKSGGKVRKDLLTNVIQQKRELGARRKEYAKLLGGEQKKLDGHFDVLDEQIEKLMEAAV
jgi:hypothetical protein